jgi:hypothetical protein
MPKITAPVSIGCSTDERVVWIVSAGIQIDMTLSEAREALEEMRWAIDELDAMGELDE